jgi:putative endonuclease
MPTGDYWVYILASRKNGTLYVGVTNSLERRVWQHKHHATDGFTSRYRVDRLVYFEQFRDVLNAIAREKQLKAGSRAKKIALIERDNTDWRDLAGDWFDCAAALNDPREPSRSRTVVSTWDSRWIASSLRSSQ